MIELVYSNKTEALLDCLANDIVELKSRHHHVLEPVDIVVPNYNMETWLTLGLAQRNSVAANLRFRRLERFIGDLVEETYPGYIKLADPAIVESAVLAALFEMENNDHSEIKPLLDYLEGDSSFSAVSCLDSRVLNEGKDLRRIQLATKMSYLFQEYSFSRPEMVAIWRSGNDIFGNNLEQSFTNPGVRNRHYAPVEAWQRALWQRVFGKNGILNRNNSTEDAHWVTLDQLVLDEQLFENLKSVELKPIHVFGVSYVARIFQLLFARLGNLCPLKIYALNPCAEFWEDVETDRELFRRLDRTINNRNRRLWEKSNELEEDEDPFGLNESDAPALSYWGRPGREYMRLLGELTDCDFKSAFSDPMQNGSGLLQNVQQDILFRVAENDLRNREKINYSDETLKLVAAPSVRREVEWIADEVWKLIKNNDVNNKSEPLRFSEIAIIINSSTRHLYMPLIETAFNAAQKIPVNITDLPGISGSRFIEALNLILSLPFGKFSRSEMLTVMSHPAVIVGFEGANPDDMAELAESLGIVYGADHSDHEGTYIDENVYNWDQGIRRLVLGSCMSEPGDGHKGVFKSTEGRWLVEEFTGAKTEFALKFGLLARSLIADSSLVRSSSMLLSEWSDLFMSQVDSYLCIQHSSDEYDRQRVLKVLSKIKDMDLGYKVSGRIATEIAMRGLQSIQGGKGNYLAEGVVVSSFLPMRAIPFKVIFILGLGEGLFPASKSRSSLDLRLAQRRAGDVDDSERDRYMFLETLLCAREKLYLSYVQRDELTGDMLQPATVIKELLYILEQGYIDGNAREVIGIEPQFRRYDPVDMAQNSFNDHISVEQRIKTIADELNPGSINANEANVSLSLVKTRQLLPVEAWEKLSAMLELPKSESLENMNNGLPKFKYETKGRDKTELKLTINNIRRFLECPMQGWAEFMLGLPVDEEILAEKEEEDFEMNRKHEYKVLRDVFVEASSGEVDLVKLYDNTADQLKLEGVYLPGILGDIAREKHLSIFDSWHSLLYEQGGNNINENEPYLPLQLSRVQFQDHFDQNTTQKLFKPLALSMPCFNSSEHNSVINIEVKGSTGVLMPCMDKTYILQPYNPPQGMVNIGNYGKLYRSFLQGLVDHLMLSAAGITQPGEKDIYVLYAGSKGEKGKAGLKINSLDKEEAITYLKNILLDMISRAHDYLLPCEAIFDLCLKKFKTGNMQFNSENITQIRAVILDMTENERVRYASLWGPVPLPQSYHPPGEEEFERMVKKRFEPIFKQIISMEGF